MMGDFNMAASIAEDAPSYPWGAPGWMQSGALTVEPDDGCDVNCYAGDALERARDNYEAVMESLYDMGNSWPGYQSPEDLVDAERERLEEQAIAAAARRAIFDREIEQAPVLQQSMRISRPLALRARRM